jgi:hypothetical protein
MGEASVVYNHPVNTAYEPFTEPAVLTDVSVQHQVPTALGLQDAAQIVSV